MNPPPITTACQSASRGAGFWNGDQEQAMQLFRGSGGRPATRPARSRDASILLGTVGAQAFRHRGDQLGCQLGVLVNDCSSLRFRSRRVKDLAGKVSRV